MAHGMSVFRLMCSTMGARSVVISFLTPVTPREDMMYRNPLASLAIIAILSSDVGAIMEIRSIPYLSQ